jgi:hypothetical protein
MRFTRSRYFVICALIVIAIIATPWLYNRWAFSHQRLPVGTWKSTNGADTLQFSNGVVTIIYVQGKNVAKMSGKAHFIGWNRVILGDSGYGPFTFTTSDSGDALTLSEPTSQDETYKRVNE